MSRFAGNNHHVFHTFFSLSPIRILWGADFFCDYFVRGIDFVDFVRIFVPDLNERQL